jgi:hypothetical protein
MYFNNTDTGGVEQWDGHMWQAIFDSGLPRSLAPNPGGDGGGGGAGHGGGSFVGTTPPVGYGPSSPGPGSQTQPGQNPNGGTMPPFIGTAFIGTAFAALLDSGGGSLANPATFNRDGDHPTVGWFVEPQTASYLEAVPLAGRWRFIKVKRSMVVRCEAAWIFSAWAGGNDGSNDSATLSIVLNGSVIGAQTVTDAAVGPGAHFWQPAAYVNLNNVAVKTGDQIGVMLTSGLGFGGDNYGANTTLLRVGRGTTSMNSGTVIWIGP